MPSISQIVKSSLIVKISESNDEEKLLIISQAEFRIGHSPDMDYQLEMNSSSSFSAAFLFFQDNWYVKNTSGGNDDLFLNGTAVPQDMMARLSTGDVLLLERDVRMTISAINKPNKESEQTAETDYYENDERDDDSFDDETVVDTEEEDDDDDDIAPPLPPIEYPHLEEEDSFIQKHGKALWIGCCVVLGILLLVAICFFLSKIF